MAIFRTGNDFAPGRSLEWLRRSIPVMTVLLVVGTPVWAQVPRYDREYPAIEYSTRRATDRVARLIERISAGAVELEHVGPSGYLTSLLSALDISTTSQALVFTRTSFQATLISPQKPRAIYFNDDTYVAWVQGSDVIEISAIDPVMGGVFYALDQDPSRGAGFSREMDLCLQCHDSYGLTGGGAPRHLVGSMLPDENGQSVFHEGWRLTDDRTPFRVRWGGWYVTGTHGGLTHRGNVIVETPADPNAVDFSRTGNLTDLSELVDTGPYPSDHSDIVALLVLEHQVHVQNEITRLGYDLRTSLHTDSVEGRPAAPGEERASRETLDLLARGGERLLHALLFVDEAELGARIEGTSGFAEDFQRRGPRDDRGRSLRDLDLRDRLFRVPLSYMIYSRPFEGLPVEARRHIYRRLFEVLSGADDTGAFEHLSEADRIAALEILDATEPDFARLR